MEFKHYGIDVLPIIQRFSLSLSNNSNILNYRWYLFDEDKSENRLTVAFGPDNVFVYVKDILREQGFWKNLENELLYIETPQKTILFRCVFLDDCFLILERIFQTGYVIFYRENLLFNFQSIKEINEFLIDAHIGSLIYELRCEDNFFIPKISNLSLTNDEEILVEISKQKLNDGEIIVKNNHSGQIEVLEWKRHFKIKAGENPNLITPIYHQ